MKNICIIYQFTYTLVHREFLNSFPSRLVIEKSKVDIENWNKPYIPGTINPDNFYTHPKNPIILEVFKQIGRADELGSGVRNVFKYGKLYGGTEPVFVEKDIFKTTVSLPSLTPSKGKLINDTENIPNDTGGVRNDTDAVKNDTDIIFTRINDAVNDTVNDAVILKIRLRMAKIIKILTDSPGLKPSELSERLDVSEVTIKRDIQKIKKLVVYKGGQKDGGYYLTSGAIEKIGL